MTDILPITDWSQESVRPALNLVLRRLERLFSKIYKKNVLRVRTVPVITMMDNDLEKVLDKCTPRNMRNFLFTKSVAVYLWRKHMQSKRGVVQREPEK